MEKAPTASSASGNARNDKPLREITLITSGRPVPDAAVSPTGFGLDICWQCRYRFFRLFFRSIHARNQDIPRLTITRRFIDNVVFQILFLRPTVQVVVVRGTAQLQSVMAGRCRFQRTNITCGLPSSGWCCRGLRRGCRLYWSRSRRLFWCWRRSRSRCLCARHRGSWFSSLRRLCDWLRFRFHGCLRFFGSITAC